MPNPRAEVIRIQLQLSVLGVIPVSRSVAATSARTPQKTTQRAPKRSLRVPEIVIAAAAASPCGASRRPVWRVSLPWISCMKTGIRKTAPKRALATITPTTIEAVKPASPKTRRSSSGCSWRSSQPTKATTRAKPPPKDASACGDPQPWIEAWVSP